MCSENIAKQNKHKARVAKARATKEILSKSNCYENGQVPTCLGLITRLGLPDCYDTPGMFWIRMDWFLQQYGLD